MWAPRRATSEMLMRVFGLVGQVVYVHLMITQGLHEVPPLPPLLNSEDPPCRDAGDWRHEYGCVPAYPLLDRGFHALARRFGDQQAKLLHRTNKFP